MKNQSFVLSICKGCKVKINKLFLPVKFALFCWFAGAYTMTVFTPVYLKSKGFTIAHLSVFTATSVFLQCLSNLVSGIIVDKTGRSKPVLITYLAMFFLTSLTFTQMPSVKECTTEIINFQCSDEGNKLPSFTTDASCNFLRGKIGRILCDMNNMTNLNDSNFHNDCESINNKLNFELEKKETLNASDICKYAIDLQNQSKFDFKLCDSKNCKSFQMNCTNNEFTNCNSNREIWIIIYGILTNVLFSTHTTIYRLFDVIVTDLTEEHDADFGRQRVFSILGSLIGPPLVGFILHKTDFIGDHKYSLAFVCSSAFTLLSALTIGTVNVKRTEPATKMWKQSLELVKKLDVFLFFLLTIIMGSAFGFQSTYSSWYLQDLGASDLLLGINRGMAGLYGLPFLYSSRCFIDKIGERNLFVLGLIAHATYSFSFSVLKEPWFALAIQSTIVLTYHLFWVAVLSNVVKIAPEGVQATVKILAGTFHYSFGKIITTLVGGIIMSTFGGRIAYAVMGGIISIYAVVYGIYIVILHLMRNRKTKSRN